MKRLCALSTILLFAGFGAAAHADPVSDAGALYTLTYEGSGNLYDFTLTIDDSKYNPGDNTDLLNAVAIDVLKSSGSYNSYSVISAPAGYSSTLEAGSLNAGGCNGNASNYLCLSFSPTPGGEPVDSPSDIYTFVFQISVPTGDLNKNDFDVKAVYDTSGDKANATYTDVYTEKIAPTLTPEPASIALLGTALLGFAGVARRLRRSH